MQGGAAGTPFGRYRLIELLGRGGMGEVWRAFDTGTERVVALKVLPAQFAGDTVFQERFRREAKSAAALDEPHVVPIYDFGEVGGRLFVTMRLIKGRDLSALLSHGALDPARAVSIVDQVASALHAAHQVNLVHRDVKPSNILVGDDDFAYLIDFGLARMVGQTRITSASNIVGTWAYMAPERITDGRCDSRADIYALACVLFECLTGSKPFPSDGLEQQIGGHIAMPPPRASHCAPGVPPALDAVIARGMAKNPHERYATTRELARDARAALGAAATGPNTMRSVVPSGPTRDWPLLAEPKLREPKRSRKRRLAVVTTVGVVAVAAALVAAMTLVPAEKHGSARVSTTAATPSAIPNTGPLTGAFDAVMGNQTLFDGTAATAADAAAFSESWRLRSVCDAGGCVAAASTGGHLAVRDIVFDKVGDWWVAVSPSRRKCKDRDEDEAWNVISLQQQADGTLSGESTQVTTTGCSNKRTAMLTRTGDTDLTQLPDPAGLPPRVISPAAGLRGSYDEFLSYSTGSTYNHRKGVRTDCLRTGDRCMSYFVDQADGKGEAFLFGNGAWTRNSNLEAPCPLGGISHITITATLLLPPRPEDPIPLLSGRGSQDETASACPNSTFEQKFTRTGD